jgi:NTP pyrophosphatase (non-canonical NTP hydrolase)
VSANEYREIYDRISASQYRVDFHRQAGPVVRLVKLQEEVGEVAQAFIGFTGANARKGFTHAEEDVAKELADVVITAMVALHDWVPSPEMFMKERLQTLTARIREEGS